MCLIRLSLLCIGLLSVFIRVKGWQRVDNYCKIHACQRSDYFKSNFMFVRIDPSWP